MKNDLGIVIQGPSDYVNELKNRWDGYNLIWSTWKGNEDKYSIDDTVVFSDLPEIHGVGNINLQRITTLNGAKKAKELGFNRVFKFRSDMIPTNPDEIIRSLSPNLNFLFFHNVEPVRKGYYVDYIMECDVDTMINIWSFDQLYGEHAEAILTESVNNKYQHPIKLFGNTVTKENDILWLKRNIRISDYNLHKEYESGWR